MAWSHQDYQKLVRWLEYVAEYEPSRFEWHLRWVTFVGWSLYGLTVGLQLAWLPVAFFLVFVPPLTLLSAFWLHDVITGLVHLVAAWREPPAEEEGIRLERHQAPALFEAVDDIAAAIGPR